MKAEKRVRYGAKEKDRLLKMVEQSKKDQKEWDSGVITRKTFSHFLLGIRKRKILIPLVGLFFRCSSYSP